MIYHLDCESFIMESKGEMVMIRKVYASEEEFHVQNKELGEKLPFSQDLSVLSTPLDVGGKRIPNRLACQAMEGCDSAADGSPDVLTKRRYERFAKGGAGLIWFEATAVMKEGRANPRQLYIDEQNLDQFKAQLEAIKETEIKENGYEPVVVMQVTHSGRYAKPNGIPEPLIAYHNPIFEEKTPISDDRIVSDEYLDRVKEALIEGCNLAKRAGFDGADIKCCHRYLNSELLSAYERPGRYGGCLENRSRFLRESVQGAIERCGTDFLVSTRMNVYDGFPYPYGFGVSSDGSLEFDPSEPAWVMKELYRYGVRLMNISMGNPYFNPHVSRPYANGSEGQEHPLQGVERILNGTAKLKQLVPEMKLICSGLSYLSVAAPHVAAALMEHGGFDVAGFGRTAFAYPDFAKDILENGQMNPKKICICCSKCSEIMRTPGGTPGCVIRDPAVYLRIYQQQCGGGTK